jgi:hypothetical protein
MPAITGQFTTPNGFIIDTPKYGPLEVTITQAGNQTTVLVTQNGSTVSEVTIINASIAAVETVINNALNGVLVGVVGGPQDFYCAVHIFALNPLSLTMISSNDPIPPGQQWWA